MRLSFVVLFFNQRDFVHDCLESIANQSRLPDEIVIHDDGSTDGTWESIDEFIANGGFPKAIDIVCARAPDNIGVSRSLARAIELASGDVLVFNGGDDVNWPDRADRVYQLFEENAHIFGAFSNLVKIDKTGHELGIYFSSTPAFARTRRDVLLLRSVWCIGASLALRRSALSRFSSVPLCHVSSDGVLAFRSLLSGQFFYIERPAVYYRHHERNLSQNISFEKKVEFYRRRPEYILELIANARSASDWPVELALWVKMLLMLPTSLGAEVIRICRGTLRGN